MTSLPVKKISIKDYAYIRGGANYAHKNWHDINKEIGILDLAIKSSSDENLCRRLLFKFDISEINYEDIGVATLEPKLSGSYHVDLHYDIYKTDTDWSGDTVTWNTAPNSTLFAKDELNCGLIKINITDALKAAVKAGENELSLLIVRKEYTEGETRIRVYNDSSKMPFIKVCKDANAETHVKELVSDSAQNALYWTKAEQEYENWCVKYNELLKKPDPEIKEINSPKEQFSKITNYKSQSNTSAFTQGQTRTYSDLADIEVFGDTSEYEYDKFGGMMIEKLKQDARGFFYSKKIGDRWWLIDPLGYPYYIKGLDVLNYSFAKSKIQADSMLKKFGSAQKWAEYTTEHLTKDLYFSAESRPAKEMLEVENPIPVQIFKGFMSTYGRQCGINNSDSGSTTFSENNTMPVFDPAFEEYADEYAKSFVADADNPYIIGYSLDNELPMDVIMLDNYLTIDPTNPVNYYSYATAWTWFKKTTGKENPGANDITPELRDKFRGFIWNKYFEVTTKAFRKYDKNHMIIGTRFLTVAAKSDWVMKVAGYYLDAITINWYFQWTPDAEQLLKMSKNADKPFIVTEFYAKAGDSEGNLGNRSGAGFYVETQQDRADYYHNFTLRMLECKNMVGWYWLQYIDNDPNNGIGDLSSRDSNKGIISNTHNEYTVLTSAMAEINRNIYKIISYFDKKYEK